MKTWIKPTERLPDNSRNIVIKTPAGYVCSGYYNPYTGRFLTPGFGHEASEWQEMPTP